MKGQGQPQKGQQQPQQPQQKIKNEITEDQKREIKEAYESFEDGGINPKELKLAMKALGFDPKNEDVGRILAQVEKKGKKPVEFEEFVDLLIEKPNKDPKVEMEKAFRILTEDGKDKITVKSLKKICVDLGENITEEELQEMITEADKDQDEEVGLDDFVQIMKKTNMF